MNLKSRGRTRRVSNPIFVLCNFVFCRNSRTTRSIGRRLCLPKIHGGIGTPGSPRLGTNLQFTGIVDAAGSKQSEVAGGKGVRFVERAHGYVLRRPFADSG